MAAPDSLAIPPVDRVDRVPLGERWLLDGFEVIPPAGGYVLLFIDMSKARQTLAALRQRGLPATYTHLIVRATALALLRHPETHQLVCNYRRNVPGQVDIGLSVAGQTSYAPVFIIPGADRMPLRELVPFVVEGVKATRLKEGKDLAGLRRQGWLIPFGFIRRFILRQLQKSFWFRRKLAGTFQVSCMSSIDSVVPFSFYSGGALGAGRVADRVIAVDGAPAVRPTMCVTVTINHQSIDGRLAGVLVNGVKDILEGDELLAEAGA